MADLRSLLDTPLDEVKVFLPAPCTYRATILSGRLDDPKVDKNGKTYQRLSLAAKLTEPGPDAPSDERERFAAEGDDTIVYFSKLIYGRNDIAGVARLLDRIGVTIAGRGLEDALAEIKGAGYEARVLIEHREYKGEMGAEVKELLPVE